jgi:mono/diheme cytochrome c family protein
MHEGNQRKKECPERNNGGKFSPSHHNYGLRINDTPIESPSSSIVLCVVTQQIQPKLAVTLAQYRERFLNDPMLGGYSSLLTRLCRREFQRSVQVAFARLSAAQKAVVRNVIMRLFLLPCAFMLLLLAMACRVALAAEIQGGKLLYMQYCSACHGQQGHGNGPVSRYITVKIPDLTLLKKTNRGVYPSDQVQSAIDGRRDVQAHGDRQMPVWGEVFTIEERKYPERSSGLKAKLIAEYVATLQK